MLTLDVRPHGKAYLRGIFLFVELRGVLLCGVYRSHGELWIRGVNIAEYAWGTCNNHTPRRDRKLLLNRRELDKLQRAGQDKGLTIVGLRMFLNERGLVKIVIGLARGRKTYDKREYLKENDAKREIDKAMKNYRR